MKTNINADLVSCLTIPGQSGFEGPIRNFLTQKLEQYGEISQDNLGSVICKIPGTDPQGIKWFISAHLDTCGFIAHSVNNGQVKCLNFGYSDTQACHMQPVTISTKKGSVHGVMYATKDDKGKLSFMVDTGSRSSREASGNLGIQAGDPIHFEIDPFLVGDPTKKIICSPRLDNRLGVFELLILAEQLKKSPPSDDVFLVGTVEEETGARGAKTAANKVKPNIALILDATYDEFPVSMSQGPVITLSDRSVILSSKVRDYLLELAKKNKIPVQTEVWNIGGTDAGSVRTIKEGVPTIPILTATKNNHTPIEMGCIHDCYSVTDFCRVILANSEDLLTVFKE
jgi:endoglucanase